MESLLDGDSVLMLEEVEMGRRSHLVFKENVVSQRLAVGTRGLATLGCPEGHQNMQP